MTTSTTPRTVASHKHARQTNSRIAGDPSIVKLAASVAAMLLAGTLLVAIIARVTLAAAARGWLDYQFPGVPAHASAAVIIFTHNCRALCGVLGLLLIAQLAAGAPNGPGRVQRTVQAGGEVILTGGIAANVLVVGAAIGAYGERMLAAMLPHGPVELAAYTVALALYLQGRRRPLPARQLVGSVAISVGLLALAAVLETFL